MSASTDGRKDVDMSEPESPHNVYSPCSSYSTFSRDVKYSFNPPDESRDEHKDYCHISSRPKQNHTPQAARMSSVSSQQPGKENRTPQSIRDEHVFESHQHGPLQYIPSSKPSSSLSNVSKIRSSVSPHMQDSLYLCTRGYSTSKHSGLSDHGSKDGIYSNPLGEILSYTSTKNYHPVMKDYMLIQSPNVQKQINSHYVTHSKNSRSSGVGTGLNAFQNQQPLTTIHNSRHYQKPLVSHPMLSEAYHQHELPSHSHEPPYPMPPQYNHQHHSQRMTWSPPSLKMSLANASSHGSRVCFSNNSLDISQEANIERKTQSFSEELDMTPPKLAPISGVLAHKPGQNLIRPIAFKPIHASPALSPVGHVTRRQPLTDDHINDTTRPHGMKLDNSTLNMQGSPDLHNGRLNVGAFNSMTQHHRLGGSSTQVSITSHHAIDTASHPQTPASYCQTMSVDSPDKNSQHNLSNSSHHNVSSSSFNNIPVSSHITAHSSHISISDEVSFSNEFRCSSERPDSIPSLNISRVSSHAVEGMLQTPSPSDSGVGELEAMLRERDAEINTLREVMERNERAIFQVYEERRNVWLQETQELQNEYERRLKIQSRKSYKTEQVLSLQVYKLQQEQKTLQEEKTKVISECDSLRQQVNQNQNLIIYLKKKLAAVMPSDVNCDVHIEDNGGEDENDNKTNFSFQEELTLKNKELIILKSQLNSFQSDMLKKNRELTEKFREVSASKEEVKSLKDELFHLREPPVLMEISTQTRVSNEVIASENINSSILEERDHTISDLQEELMEIRAHVILLSEEHNKEQAQWLDEKNKVIRYQKQLQLNYVQMQRKNAALEKEVQQLTLELENRDMKLIALSGEESVC